MVIGVHEDGRAGLPAHPRRTAGMVGVHVGEHDPGDVARVLADRREARDDRGGADLSPVSTRVTEPSSCTSAKELTRSLPAVGIRQIPGASSMAGVFDMGGA